MRIISQDGQFDLPYDRFIVGINQNKKSEITAWSASDSIDVGFAMGTYGSEEKAKKALEMMHDAYKVNQFAKSFITGGITGFVQEEKSEETEEYFEMVMDSFVWQFPPDEEVEV